MHLSRLEAFGFKSFAHKLEMTFNQGVTAVVGPNGCGKSNIVDAIRWALGEQRPHALRSDAMEDVIFGGTQKRKPLGMAEVSVTIENSDHALPIEYTEVTATRRLYRSGESEYLLNKTPCRLMDITHLFMDTGIGAHSYSIIEQGMMDAILSEKPEDRRYLFEEAAGITKYKVRRKAALQKLALVEQDLLRVNDIVFEVGAKAKALKQQMAKAKRYRQYREQIKTLGIQCGRHRFAALCAEAGPLSQRIEQLRIELSGLAAESSTKEARIERWRLELLEEEAKLDALAKSSDRYLGAIHQTEEEIAVARERIESHSQLAVRLEAQRNDLQGKQEALQHQEHGTQQTLEETGKAHQACRQRLAERQSQLGEFQESLDRQRTQVEGQRADVLNAFQACSAQQNDLQKDRSRAEHLGGRRVKLTEDVRHLDQRIASIRERSEANTREVSKIQGSLDELRNRREASGAQLQDLEERIRRMEAEEQKLKADIQAQRARLEVMQKVKAGYEGYPASVRKLLLEAPFAGGVLGALADMMDTDDQHVRALEAALGEFVHAVVVDSVETAQEAVAFLNSKGAGRAILLPLDQVTPPREEPTPETEGGARRATDLVRCEAGLTPLVRALLGRTLVVEDLQHALSARARLAGTRLVTRSGEVVGAIGEIIGGGGREAAGLIGRQRQITQLEGVVEKRSVELSGTAGQLKKAREAVQALRTQIAALDREIAGAHQRLVDLDKQCAQYQVEEQGLGASRSALAAEDKEVEQALQELENTIDQKEGRLAELEEERDRLSSGLEIATESLRFHEREHQARSEITQQLSVELASLAARCDSLEHEVRRIGSARSEIAESLTRCDEEIARAQERVAELQAQRRRAQEELGTHQEKRAALEAQRSEQRAGYEELRNEMMAQEKEAKTLRRSHAELQTQLQALELRLSELRVKAGDLRDQVLEHLNVDVKEMELEEAPEGFDGDQAQRSVAKLEQRINRMGPINMRAIEEYEAESHRLEFLTKQRDDLVEAERTLKATISEINRTAHDRFSEAFELIRGNFRETFARFFGNGEADLLLLEQADPLEAGIEIVARPEGKTLKNISLLSGGEKALTAIALLFGIYLVKPSPFCILDEVDAPLDDANLGRFLSVLASSSKNTQFIIVTHSKKTMEAAHTLYGVTMEEAGVSKLVSVKLGNNGDDSGLLG